MSQEAGERLGRGLTEVVESIEDDIKGLEPVDVKLGLLDVCVDRVNVDIGVEGTGCLSCYLDAGLIEHERSRVCCTDHGFALPDILLPEEKLSIEVGEVYGIQVQEGDVAKASQNDVFDCVRSKKGCCGRVRGY